MKVTLHLAHTSPSKEKAYSSSRLIKVRACGSSLLPSQSACRLPQQNQHAATELSVQTLLMGRERSKTGTSNVQAV